MVTCAHTTKVPALEMHNQGLGSAYMQVPVTMQTTRRAGRRRLMTATLVVTWPLGGTLKCAHWAHAALLTRQFKSTY